MKDTQSTTKDRQSTRKDIVLQQIRFHYYTPDHLGNIREVVGGDGTLEQVTDYYPFGTPYYDGTGLNPSLQTRKFGGKELDLTHGYVNYDFGARGYNPLLGVWDRMDQMCEKYYDVNPYAYCHNDPQNHFDTDGMDDWYTSYGDYLYRDNAESDRIMLARWTIHVEFVDGPHMVAIGGIPIDETKDLYAETYSNIFTDIISKMPNVDVGKLRKEHVSVVVWNNFEDGEYSSTNYYNNPDFETGKLSSTGNTRITASINLFNNNQTYLSTVSNVQSILGIHEYLGHLAMHLGDETHTHHKIYEMQINDPTWNKITEELKSNIIYNYLKYLRNEK